MADARKIRSTRTKPTIISDHAELRAAARTMLAALERIREIDGPSPMVDAAINEANRKVDEAMKGKLGGMLPPGLGGLFG